MKNSTETSSTTNTRTQGNNKGEQKAALQTKIYYLWLNVVFMDQILQRRY